MATTKIDKREDTNPERGKHEYGNVEFADTTNKKYPIDTVEHIEAAWRYIHKTSNAAKYEAGEVKTIKGRIQSAAKKHGITLHEAGEGK